MLRRLIEGLFKGARDELLEEVVSSYGLEWTESNLGHISGSGAPNWWFGQSGGVQFGIRPLGGEWEVTVGRIPPVIDIELTRVDRARRGPAIRIEDAAPGARRVAEYFRITMAGVNDERFLGPQLAIPGVSDALCRLSSATWKVGIYRTGIELRMTRAALTRTDFDYDLSRAVDMARRLESYARENPHRPT